MKSSWYLMVLFVYMSSYAIGQNSVGVLSIEPEKTFTGFNLFFPHNQSNVYLVDNCGRIANIWEDENYFPGNSVYLTEEGNLIKCKRGTTSAINDPIWAGGGGEIVEIRSWDNEILHQFALNDEQYRLHHDVAPLPNGNILMIAWQSKTLEEAIEAGRDPNNLPQEKIWSESILEWDPVLDSIVWQWDAWDHLIQDIDNTKSNFGQVALRPEKIDINYDEHDGHPDWLHINAIDYNITLDHIVMSVPYFNELWVIDHSTTTEEARMDSGGNSGKGGDLLYRWGNPMTYRQGSISDKKLFFQHDTHWEVPDATSNDDSFSRIVLFNNRVSDNLSTANSLILPWDEASNQYILTNNLFGPENFESSISHPDPSESRSVSSSLSSAQILPNGNYLLCAGRWGYSYEITPNNDLVWEYITPIVRGSIASQGDTLTINNNLTFRLKRYSADFAAFANRDLQVGEYIEMNPDTSFCNLVVSNTIEPGYKEINLYPNPATSVITIDGAELMGETVQITNTQGSIIQSVTMKSSTQLVNIESLESGTYFIIGNKGVISKFIKI